MLKSPPMIGGFRTAATLRAKMDAAAALKKLNAKKDPDPSRTDDRPRARVPYAVTVRPPISRRTILPVLTDAPRRERSDGDGPTGINFGGKAIGGPTGAEVPKGITSPPPDAEPVSDRAAAMMAGDGSSLFADPRVKWGALALGGVILFLVWRRGK